LQLIDSTVPVLDTLADKLPARFWGATPSAAAVRPRTTPDVATCCSVAMFGTTGVPMAASGYTSTWEVERKTAGWAEWYSQAPAMPTTVAIMIHRPCLRSNVMTAEPPILFLWDAFLPLWTKIAVLAKPI